MLRRLVAANRAKRAAEKEYEAARFAVLKASRYKTEDGELAADVQVKVNSVPRISIADVRQVLGKAAADLLLASKKPTQGVYVTVVYAATRKPVMAQARKKKET